MITVSAAEKAAITRYYPESLRRIVAIQNGGLPFGSQIETHKRGDEPFVLYVGSLSKRKNLPGMLEVAMKLAAKRNLKFVFVGGIHPVLNKAQSKYPKS